MENLDIFYIIQNAEDIFRRLRWAEGPECPECHSRHIYVCSNGRYRCADCGRTFTIKTGTVLEGSHISISKWMVALYLMLDSKGISSIELGRKLGITQKTAYYMLMRLRYGMTQEGILLNGEVAVDEVYIGGSFSKMRLRKKQELIERYQLPKHPRTVAEKLAVANAVNNRYKQPVFAGNDGDKIFMQVIPNPVSSKDVETVFNAHIIKSGTTTVSDSSRLYNNWEERTGCKIFYNNHSIGKYVTEDGRSSNRIEGTFSWLKRDILPAYVHMKREYIQLYLNEFVFRWNHRNCSIEDKLNSAVKKICSGRNRAILGQFNTAEYELLREDKYDSPWSIFETGLIKEIKIGSVVYRYEDYLYYKNLVR